MQTLFDIREFEGTPAPLMPKHRWLEENGLLHIKVTNKACYMFELSDKQ